MSINLSGGISRSDAQHVEPCKTSDLFSQEELVTVFGAVEQVVYHLLVDEIKKSVAISREDLYQRLLTLESDDCRFHKYGKTVSEAVGVQISDKAKKLAHCNITVPAGGQREFETAAFDDLKESDAFKLAVEHLVTVIKRATQLQPEVPSPNVSTQKRGSPFKGVRPPLATPSSAGSNTIVFDELTGFSNVNIMGFDNVSHTLELLSSDRPVHQRITALTKIGELHAGDILGSEHWHLIRAKLRQSLTDESLKVRKAALDLHLSIFRAATPVQTGEIFVSLCSALGARFHEHLPVASYRFLSHLKNGFLRPLELKSLHGCETEEAESLIHEMQCFRVLNWIMLRIPQHWTHYPDKLLEECLTTMSRVLSRIRLHNEFLFPPLPSPRRLSSAIPGEGPIEDQSEGSVHLFGSDFLAIVDPDGKWFKVWFQQVPSREMFLRELVRNGIVSDLLRSLEQLTARLIGQCHARHTVQHERKSSISVHQGSDQSCPEDAGDSSVFRQRGGNRARVDPIQVQMIHSAGEADKVREISMTKDIAALSMLSAILDTVEGRKLLESQTDLSGTRSKKASEYAVQMLLNSFLSLSSLNLEKLESITTEGEASERKLRNIVGKALQAVAESGDETHCSLLIDVVLKILEEAISHLERVLLCSVHEEAIRLTFPSTVSLCRSLDSALSMSMWIITSICKAQFFSQSLPADAALLFERTLRVIALCLIIFRKGAMVTIDEEDILPTGLDKGTASIAALSPAQLCRYKSFSACLKTGLLFLQEAVCFRRLRTIISSFSFRGFRAVPLEEALEGCDSEAQLPACLPPFVSFISRILEDLLFTIEESKGSLRLSHATQSICHWLVDVGIAMTMSLRGALWLSNSTAMAEEVGAKLANSFVETLSQEIKSSQNECGCRAPIFETNTKPRNRRRNVVDADSGQSVTKRSRRPSLQDPSIRAASTGLSNGHTSSCLSNLLISISHLLSIPRGAEIIFDNGILQSCLDELVRLLYCPSLPCLIESDFYLERFMRIRTSGSDGKRSEHLFCDVSWENRRALRILDVFDVLLVSPHLSLSLTGQREQEIRFRERLFTLMDLFAQFRWKSEGPRTSTPSAFFHFEDAHYVGLRSLHAFLSQPSAAVAMSVGLDCEQCLQAMAAKLSEGTADQGSLPRPLRPGHHRDIFGYAGVEAVVLPSQTNPSSRPHSKHSSASGVGSTSDNECTNFWRDCYPPLREGWTISPYSILVAASLQKLGFGQKPSVILAGSGQSSDIDGEYSTRSGEVQRIARTARTIAVEQEAGADEWTNFMSTSMASIAMGVSSTLFALSDVTTFLLNSCTVARKRRPISLAFSEAHADSHHSPSSAQLGLYEERSIELFARLAVQDGVQIAIKQLVSDLTSFSVNLRSIVHLNDTWQGVDWSSYLTLLFFGGKAESAIRFLHDVSHVDGAVVLSVPPCSHISETFPF